jgi:DNA-binding IscR family transcriptional regulator
LITPGNCWRDKWCAVHFVWADVQQQIKDILASKNIAELADQSLAARLQLKTGAAPASKPGPSIYQIHR